MANETGTGNTAKLDPDSIQRLLETDSGARHPDGPTGHFLLAVALCWSLFQLWHASPLPFMLDLGVFNSTQARALHLGFAMLLAYLAWPAHRGHTGDTRIPWLDWLLALTAGFAATYGFWFYAGLSERPGMPLTRDIAVAAVGMLLLLEAARRTLGLPLVIVALVFLAYVFLGDAAILPEMLRWKGASIDRAMSHQWLTTEGVYGIALGVSTSFVFLFVLFGSLLEQAGAGGWFIRVAFSLLGAMRGGPAKAAVLASGMTGVISGSSIANVVTTGTFTIPLMRRVGFTRDKAGAIEVASSVNGQLMPPVMGAAAFLMVEYVGISYVEVIRHAILPAIIAYAALLYMVHLEALKGDMRGLPRLHPSRPLHAVLAFGLTIAGLVILSAAVYWGVGWIRTLTGDAAVWIVTGVLAVIHVGLIRHAARFAPLQDDDPSAPLTEIPDPGPTIQSGLHFLLPVILLIWCLMVERLSPGLSAFWATVALILILLTQRPLFAWFRGDVPLIPEIRRGGIELVHGLIGGARNMTGIAVATATAGIIVGTVTLTGIGQVMTEFVELISGGNLLAMLILTAFICLVLGMGLPTTANYIVVSSLMAPVVVTLAGEQGLIVPLIAVHLFVFYFGIMADVTPPVGLASFAAAAVSGGDPIRTGVHAFVYSLRTVVLPFLFLFNTELLLIGIESIPHLIMTTVIAIIGMLVFAAGTQGWFLRRCRLWETAALLLVAFSLFRPGFWVDRLVPPFEDISAGRLQEWVEGLPANEDLRLVVEREDFDGDRKSIVTVVEPGPKADFTTRMRAAGLVFLEREGDTWTAEPAFNGPLDNPRYQPEMTIERIRAPVDQPAREWIYIPALLLLGGIMVVQWRRPGDFEEGTTTENTA
jgi:TRAP transporter 4TM/12TM fusion protein